jgi:hypothetical protein
MSARRLLRASLRWWDGLSSCSRAAARASVRLTLPAFIPIAAAGSVTRYRYTSTPTSVTSSRARLTVAS